MVQTCCLIMNLEESSQSLKHSRRLQVAIKIHRQKLSQNEAFSGAYFVPGAALLQELPFIPGAHNKIDKVLDIVALKKRNQAKALGLYCHH